MLHKLSELFGSKKREEKKPEAKDAADNKPIINKVSILIVGSADSPEKSKYKNILADSDNPSIGIDFSLAKYNGTTFMTYTNAGQERFNSLTASSLRSDVFILTPSTTGQLSSLYNQLDASAKNKVVLVAVDTNSDNREGYDLDAIKNEARTIGILCIEAPSKANRDATLQVILDQLAKPQNERVQEAKLGSEGGNLANQGGHIPGGPRMAP